MKIKGFLNKTTEVTNGDLLRQAISIGLFTVFSLYLNNKLYETRIDNISKDIKIDELENKLEEIEKSRIDNDVEIL